jgi:Ribbon-helix-helix protein, copG family.
MTKETISARLRPPTSEALDEYADEKGMSKSQAVDKLLTDALKIHNGERKGVNLGDEIVVLPSETEVIDASERTGNKRVLRSVKRVWYKISSRFGGESAKEGDK